MRTPIVPHYRPEVQEYFMDRANTPNFIVEVGDFDVPSRPLKVGKKFDLIGISHSDVLLSHGKIDMTDRVHPESLRIKCLYDVNARGEVICHDLSGEESAKFVQVGDIWRVDLHTIVDGLAASFAATFYPNSSLLETASSVWGYTLEGTRGN